MAVVNAILYNLLVFFVISIDCIAESLGHTVREPPDAHKFKILLLNMLLPFIETDKRG